MSTPALDAANVSWEGATLSAASPALDAVNVSWYVPASVVIEPASLRLTISRGVLIETATTTPLQVSPTPARLSYGSHEITQISLDGLLRVSMRSGPRMSAGRPEVSFLYPQEVRGAGGARLSAGVVEASLTAEPGGAALSFGAPSLGFLIGPPPSVTLAIDTDHELQHSVRAWPLNVLRVGVPYVSKGSPHP